MAALLDMSNGRANMAFIGATPWHGDGERMPANATIEDWVRAAGMAYKVKRAPVQFTNGSLHTYAGKDVLYRDDTNMPLGVVSEGYKIVQPDETIEFFRDLCEQQDMTMETAGVLKGGAVYWALARTGHTMDIDRDITNAFVLLSTSADGSRSTDARLTSVRVVCNNTLSAANYGKAQTGVKVRHNTVFNAADTKQKMGLVTYDAQWEAFKAGMEKLATIKVSADDARDFFSELLRPKAERAKPRADVGASSLDDLLSLDFRGGVNKASTDKAPVERAIRGLEDLTHSYYRAPGAVPGTAYGLVQGVTHFIDHVRGGDDSRLVSAWFGQGATLKDKALEKALAMA